MSATVSLALCTCNGGRFIAEQLESLAQQSRRPDEIVICDDASTDDTVAVAEETMRRLGLPGRVVRNAERLGYSPNFEQAMRQSTCDLIFFCDQDDVWHPEKIARFVAIFREKPAVMLVASDSDLVDEDLRPLNRRFLANVHFHGGLRRKVKTHPFLAFLALRPLPGHAMAIRREVRDRLVPVPPTWDYDAWASVVSAAMGEVVILEEALVQYRRHRHQTVGTFDASPVQMAGQLGPGEAASFYRQIKLFRTLRERLEDPAFAALTGLAQRLAEVDGKIEFLKARARMKDRPRWRWTSIATQFFLGHYFSFGQGWLSLARDVLGK